MFYLKYGNYGTALSEVGLATQKEPLISGSGFQYGVRETWTITGFLQAADQTALIAALNALEVAFSVNQQTIALLTDANVVARSMPGTSDLGGTRVVGGVSYPENGLGTAEFGDFRTYSITVVGEYLLPGVAPATLLAWTEALSFQGGGPRFVHLQPLNGLPVKQQTAEATPYRVVQHGSALGLKIWPTPPGPIWPDAEKRDERKIDPKTPKRDGGNVRPVYRDYEIEWTYVHESATELTGTPTLWR